MKTPLFVLLILVIPFQLIYGQKDIRDGRHIFNYKTTIPKCDENGIVSNPSVTHTMEREWIFSIERILPDDYVITVARFEPESSLAISQTSSLAFIQNTLTFKDPNNKPIYFKLSKTQYDLNADRFDNKVKFVVGASTTLIKIRPGNDKEGEDKIFSEFGNDFNLGFTAGVQIKPFRKTEFYINLVGGFGFSAIKATPQTTRDFITSESTQGTITFTTGIVIEFDKFQISGFMGWDNMSGEIGENWIYNKRLWFGIGFGYQMFVSKGKTTNTIEP